jgi:hypothetical protein
MNYYKCSKLKLTLLSFILLFLNSTAWCEYHVWKDPISLSNKEINLDNGEVSVEIRPNVFHRIAKIKFDKNYRKTDFINKDIRYFKDGKFEYFLVKELKLLYLLDVDHAELHRFDMAKLSEELFFDSTWYDYVYYSSFIIISLLVLLMIYFLIRWVQRLKSLGTLSMTKPRYFDEFLQLFLEQGSDYTCSTLTLNELIKIEKKSYETQRQLRSKFIRNVTTYLEKKYKVKSPIYRITSSDDKRFVNYQLSKTAFVKLEYIANKSTNV